MKASSLFTRILLQNQREKKGQGRFCISPTENNKKNKIILKPLDTLFRAAKMIHPSELEVRLGGNAKEAVLKPMKKLGVIL